jgi:hypothetical protein
MARTVEAQNTIQFLTPSSAIKKQQVTVHFSAGSGAVEVEILPSNGWDYEKIENGVIESSDPRTVVFEASARTIRLTPSGGVTFNASVTG